MHAIPSCVLLESNPCVAKIEKILSQKLFLHNPPYDLTAHHLALGLHSSSVHNKNIWTCLQWFTP